MALPTVAEVLDAAREDLNRIYQRLGDVQDRLRSDTADRMTEADLDEIERMRREIASAKSAVESAKTRKGRR